MKPGVETVKLSVIRGRIGTMSTLTITEFLEARIAGDEQAARAANVDPWWWEEKYVDMDDPVQSFGPRFAPARVLAECAAKRAILDLHPTRIYTDEEPGFSMILWDCMCDRQTLKPCPTIATLAAVYASHPDYQQEWAL